MCNMSQSFINSVEQNQDSSNKQVVNYSHFINTSLRIARFSPLRSSKINSPTAFKSLVLSVLATFSCVYLQRPPNSDFHRTAADVVLTCPFCCASFSLADILRRISHSAINSTKELLRELGVLHMDNCKGHSALELLNKDDTHLSVAESLLKAPSSLSLLPETDQSAKWIESGRVKEELNHFTASGNLLQTHPELFQQNATKFAPLPNDRLKCAVTDVLLLSDDVHARYGQTTVPRDTQLNYFFVQTPPDQTGPNPVQIPINDARRRIREVHYDRGTIVNAMDIEAKEMADCRRRYDSFNKSEFLKGKLAAYQLAQLGFFFVGERNSPGKLRCSFCRRTIHMFTTDEARYFENDFDRRLIELLHRHSHLSATCPFAIGLNGDDKRFCADDNARVIEPFLRTQTLQISNIVISLSPYVESSAICISAATILSQSAAGLPPLDGELSTSYNSTLAELEYERFSLFDSEPDFESKPSVDDDLTLLSTTIDYLIGGEPKYRDFISAQSRIESFDKEAWCQQTISTSSSPHLTPESFASAGFFYTGTADNVCCFWCGLGLSHWEATDDPITQHVRFTPRCTWLLRTMGRFRVKALYMKFSQNIPSASVGISSNNPADCDFIRNVQEITGGLDPDCLCPVDYRTEMREAKARVDLPANRAMLDEFGYSVDLLLHALQSQLKETGNDHESVQQLLESLWAYEEWKSEKQIDSDADFVARAEELRRHMSDRTSAQTSTKSTADSYSQSQTGTGGAEDNVCVVCMSAAREVVLMPCGHLAVCQSCYSRLQQCPICRAVIRGAIRSYL